MSPNRAKQLLPLIKAFSEGKKIQYKSQDVWVDIDRPGWCDDVVYRVKPEPKTVWINIYPDLIGGIGHETKELADEAATFHETRVACIQITYAEGEGL